MKSIYAFKLIFIDENVILDTFTRYVLKFYI